MHLNAQALSLRWPTTADHALDSLGIFIRDPQFGTLNKGYLQYLEAQAWQPICEVTVHAHVHAPARPPVAPADSRLVPERVCS